MALEIFEKRHVSLKIHTQEEIVHLASVHFFCVENALDATIVLIDHSPKADFFSLGFVDHFLCQLFVLFIIFFANPEVIT